MNLSMEVDNRASEVRLYGEPIEVSMNQIFTDSLIMRLLERGCPGIEFCPRYLMVSGSYMVVPTIIIPLGGRVLTKYPGRILLTTLQFVEKVNIVLYAVRFQGSLAPSPCNLFLRESVEREFNNLIDEINNWK